MVQLIQTITNRLFVLSTFAIVYTQVQGGEIYINLGHIYYPNSGCYGNVVIVTVKHQKYIITIIYN